VFSLALGFQVSAGESTIFAVAKFGGMKIGFSHSAICNSDDCVKTTNQNMPRIEQWLVGRGLVVGADS
jgi:hypothetical protein